MAMHTLPSFFFWRIYVHLLPIVMSIVSYVYCTRTAGPVVVGFDEPGLIVGEEFGALFIQVSVNQQIDSDVTVNVAVIAGSATEREG